MALPPPTINFLQNGMKSWQTIEKSASENVLSKPVTKKHQEPIYKTTPYPYIDTQGKPF